MAVAIVSRTSLDGGYNSSTATGAVAVNCNGATLLIVGVLSSELSPLTGMTYNGVAMTEIGSAVAQSDIGFRMQNFYLKNPASGTNNLIGQSTVYTGYMYGEALGLTGEHATSPIGANTKTGVSGASNTAVLTGVADTGNMLVGFLEGLYGNPGTITPPSGWTLEQSKLDYSNGWSASLSKNPAGATGTINPTFVNSGWTHFGVQAVEIIAAAVGGSQSVSTQSLTNTSSLGQIGVGTAGLPTEMTMQALDNGTLLGEPSLTFLQDINLASIVSLSLLGKLDINGAQNLEMMGVTSGVAIGRVNASWPTSFGVGSIVNTSLLGRPSIGFGGISISVAGIVSKARLGRPKRQVTTLFPLVLQPGEVRTLTGIFTPKAIGLRTGSVSLQTSTGIIKSVPVSGVGVGSVLVVISDGIITAVADPVDPSVLAPIATFGAANMSFGTIPDGFVGDLVLTVTNTGTAPLIITSAVATGDFSVIGIN